MLKSLLAMQLHRSYGNCAVWPSHAQGPHSLLPHAGRFNSEFADDLTEKIKYLYLSVG